MSRIDKNDSYRPNGSGRRALSSHRFPSFQLKRPAAAPCLWGWDRGKEQWRWMWWWWSIEIDGLKTAYLAPIYKGRNGGQEGESQALDHTECLPGLGLQSCWPCSHSLSWAPLLHLRLDASTHPFIQYRLSSVPTTTWVTDAAMSTHNPCSLQSCHLS